MLYTPLWLQGGSYPAQYDRLLVSAALGGGTVSPSGSTLGMVPSVVNGTMNVQFTAGRSVVPVGGGDLGAYLCAADDIETVTSPASPPSGQNRYDLYIARVRDPAENGSYTQNDWIYDVVPGTPSASPTPPTAASAPAGSLALAYCLVPGAAAALTAANLVDLRVLQGSARGKLAYVASTANTAGTTTSLDWITAPAVHVDGTRRIKVLFNGTLNAGTANDQSVLRLMEGSTALMLLQHRHTAAGSVGREMLSCFWSGVPSAGSHTYKLTIALNNGTGPITGIHDPSFPAQILVEDIGT
jgi:hypothetical protein